MYDIQTVRQDFPILDTRVYDKPLIYLDNAATTQKPRAVIEAVTEGYSRYNANIHRGVHYLSRIATERHEAARARIARFINAAAPEEVLFVRGTTEAINMVASSYGRLAFDKDSEVIVSAAEHHSNIVPWQLAGVKLRVVPIAPDGQLRLDIYKELFNEHTRMVALAHAGNVSGTINPIKEMIAVAHTHGVPVLIDGAQSVAHLRVDVQDLDADFFAFSGHKVYGPAGIGVLYGKRARLEEMPPYQGGGEMIRKVTFAKTTFNELPYKFEAGTPDYIGSHALATALDYIDTLGIDNIAAHEQALLAHMTAGIEAIPGARLFGTAPHKSAVLSFLIGDIHPYDMGMLLDRLGIAIRTGHHCAEPLMDTLGISGTARASLGLYNTIDDVETFITSLNRVVSML